MPKQIFDSKVNFGVVTVTQYYGATDTQIGVDDATRLPSTAPFNATWYNDQAYPGRPHDDPNREVVRVTSINVNTLVLASSGGNRVAQEGTTASTKNTPGGVYKLIVGVTAKDFDDLEDATVDVGSAYAWITEHGSVGDGVTDDKAAFDAAIAAGRTLLICPSGTYRIANDLTIGSGIVLVLQPGATLAPDSGKTVTIQGMLIAHSATINGGGGSVSVAPALARYIGADVIIRGQRITTGTAAPTTGTWAKGDLCVNSSPGTGDPLLWRCTTGGTPGTWEAVTAGGGVTTLQSDEVALDAIAPISATITHGLGAAPALKDCTICISVSSGYNVSDPPYCRAPMIMEVTSTTIKCLSSVIDAGATNTKGRFVVWVKTG